MSRYHFDIAQGTPEWHAIRAGKWTASQAAIIMGGLDTKGLSDLINTVAWERVFGPTNESGFKSSAMQRGNDLEAEAREWCAFSSDSVIAECGFVEHPTIANVGWSPDGLHAPSHKTGVEIKCLLHKAYMDVMFRRDVPAEYRWQVRWGIWCGQLDFLDFVAYHPQPGGIVIPVTSNDPGTEDQMAARVYLLEKRVTEVIERIQNQKRQAA